MKYFDKNSSHFEVILMVYRNFWNDSVDSFYTCHKILRQKKKMEQKLVFEFNTYVVSDGKDRNIFQKNDSYIKIVEYKQRLFTICWKNIKETEIWAKPY